MTSGTSTLTWPVRNKEYKFVRELYDRMIGLNLQPKKMKAMFKKYMEFEEEHGDQKSIELVRKKALEYVESKFGSVKEEDDKDEDELVDPMDQLMDMDDE